MKRFTIAIADCATTAASVASDLNETKYAWARFRHCTQIGDSIVELAGCVPTCVFRDADGVVHVHAGGSIHVIEEPEDVTTGSIADPMQQEATGD